MSVAPVPASGWRASAAQTVARQELARWCAPLALGLVLWGLSLTALDVHRVGDYGLLGSLPVTWYLALATLVAGGMATIAAGPPRPWLMAGYVGAVVLALYATIPALADAPQYPWTYKHIGVTQLIDAHGGIDTTVDIYNRWPGFFAVAALFSRLSGVGDPVSFAGWAEPLFMAVDALLVGAIAHALLRQARPAGAAALLFVLFNWVGQTYFSPQALASALGLTLLLIVLRALPHDGPARWATTRDRGEVAPLRWATPVAVALVVALDLAIVLSHQLTPFALAAQVAVLVWLRVAGGWALVAAMLALPAAFLVANLGYVQEHFTLLTSLDPFENLRTAGTYDVQRIAGKALNARLSMLLSALMFLGALAAARYLTTRRPGGPTPLALVGLAFAPFVVVALQSYGGEASLRMILYAAPFASILIGAAVTAPVARRRRTAVAVGTACAAAALSVPAFYGVSQLNVIPRSTVAASEAFYADAPKGSVLVLAGPGFPLRVGARYDEFRGPVGDADPNLLKTDRLRGRMLGAGDLPYVIRRIHQYSTRGFLAFSGTEDRWAHTFGLTPDGALAGLERAVAASPDFRLWKRTATARIYELTTGTRARSR